jgi:hypothetical protein
MKKLLLSLALVLVLAASTFAATMDRKVYSLTIENSIIELDFAQGPFGPGEQGIASILVDGVLAYTVGYTFYGDKNMGVFNNGVVFFIVDDSVILASPIATLQETTRASK